MQDTQTYNGWKNRTTWALHLWMTNDEPLYREAIFWAGAGRLEEWVRNEWHLMPTLMRTDVGVDLSGVDWDSIAESLTE